MEWGVGEGRDLQSRCHVKSCVSPADVPGKERPYATVQNAVSVGWLGKLLQPYTSLGTLRRHRSFNS